MEVGKFNEWHRDLYGKHRDFGHLFTFRLGRWAGRPVYANGNLFKSFPFASTEASPN